MITIQYITVQNSYFWAKKMTNLWCQGSILKNGPTLHFVQKHGPHVARHCFFSRGTGNKLIKKREREGGSFLVA